jgi:hypothetical protein
MDLPQVFDQQGEEQDWTWLTENFGAVAIERAEVRPGVGQVYRVVKLQDSEGPAVQIVNVVDQDGFPMNGARVVRHWPGAPSLAGRLPPVGLWRDEGVFGETNAEGNIGYGMGHGDYYFPPGPGASAVWVASEEVPSDLAGGLGMLGGTNHRHLDVFYQLVDVEQVPVGGPPDQPPVEPPVDPPPGELPKELWQALFDKLDTIIEMLENKT